MFIERANVLIETYWNVNVRQGRNIVTELNVLIETYWNVNAIIKFDKHVASNMS